MRDPAVAVAVAFAAAADLEQLRALPPTARRAALEAFRARYGNDALPADFTPPAPGAQGPA